jgi:transcriptional regulator with XRE-family HTH domain
VAIGCLDDFEIEVLKMPNEKLNREAIGDRVRYILEVKFYNNQMQMSRAAGCSQAALSLIAANRQKPGANILNKISKISGVNAAWLHTGEGQPFLELPDAPDAVDLVKFAEVVKDLAAKIVSNVDTVIKPLREAKQKAADKCKTMQKRIERRWEDNIPHHPEAEQIVRAIAEYLPELNIKFGGDGDTREDLQYALSLWIEDGKPDLVPEYDK